MKTSKQIAEGISNHQWYGYYECEQCKKIRTYKINRPAVVETEYSVSSMKSTPIGINVKNWPDND
jgi:hypothetical protein